MTVLNFPDNPASVDNTYIAPNGVTYYYDGVKWVGQNSSNRQIDRITAGNKSLIINTDGNVSFPNNTINAGENSITVTSGDYADLTYLNLTNSSTWGAGTVIDSIVSVDDQGIYLGVSAINSSNTDTNLGTWSINNNGNLITEVLHESADSTTGDITDAAGNSLIYVPTTNTAPTHDHTGLLWFNTEDGRAYIRYNHQWVDANPPVIPAVSTYLDGLAIEGQTISSTDYVESAVKIGGDLLPDEDLTYNLGSPDRQWKHLYVDSNTIYMGGQAVSLTDQGLTVNGRTAVYEIDGGVASTWLTA